MKKSNGDDKMYVGEKIKKGEWIDVVLNAIKKACIGFPIVTMNPKREETCLIRFTGLVRHERMAEEIYDNTRRKRKQYKTVSDVNRAAYYLGIENLYWYEKENFPENFESWGSEYANSVRRMEVWLTDLERHDNCVKFMGTAHDYFKKGACDQQEFHDHVMEHIGECKKSFRESLVDAYKRILNGESVTSIQMGTYHGGDRKSERYRNSK